MPNQHADRKGFTVRPPEEDLEAAKRVLAEHGKDARGFVTACLRALVADPAAFLAQLAKHWPAPKLTGRRKAD